MTFKQGGIIMPHLLHHGASIFWSCLKDHLFKPFKTSKGYWGPILTHISRNKCEDEFEKLLVLNIIFLKKNIFYRNYSPWIPVLYTSLDKYPPQVSSGIAGQGWLHFAPSAPCLPKAFPHQHSLPYCRPAYLKPNKENDTHKNSLVQFWMNFSTSIIYC